MPSLSLVQLSITPKLGRGVTVEVDVVVGVLVVVGDGVDEGLITDVDVWIEEGEMGDRFAGPLQDNRRRKRKIAMKERFKDIFKIPSAYMRHQHMAS